MKKKKIIPSLLLVVACAVLLPGVAGQSVADAAQKERERKQQEQQSGAIPRLYTNEDIDSGEHDPLPAATPVKPKSNVHANKSDSKGKLTPAQWREKIRRQKQTVQTLQNQVDQMQAGLHPAATAGLYSDITPPSSRRRQRQEQLDRQQQRLAVEKKKLEEMQEAARKQGYGNSVYDPG